MGSKDKDKTKEDHLAPTKIEKDDSVDNVKAEKNLSDHELQYRLDLYSKGDADQFFKIQRIKKDYLNKTKQDQKNRTISDLYYSDGKKELLPHVDYRNIADTREELDQNYRDHVVWEAKEEYRKHDTLSKLLNEHSAAEQSKVKDEKSKKIYKNLGKLMAQYNIVNDSRNKAIEQLKYVKLNENLAYPANDLAINQSKTQEHAKNLSKYFEKHQPTSSKIRDAFSKMKNKERER